MKRSKKKRMKKGIPEPEKDQKPGHPKKIGEIIIDVYESMDVNVRQFPTDHAMSMLVLGNALLAVNNWFHQEAQKKNAQKIILAKPPMMSAADIEKIAKKN